MVKKNVKMFFFLAIDLFFLAVDLESRLFHQTDVF